MFERLHELRRWAGMDRPVSYAFAGRAWSVLSGPVTILLIGSFFSPEEQGYYYAFASVMGLQVFLEMGFSQCVVQFASHEFARLRFAPGGRIEGDPVARSRLVSLGRLSLKWYGVMSLLLVFGVGLGGHLFFSARQVSAVAWVWPWWSLCLAAGLAMTLLPFGSLLEGCNQLAFVYGLRTLAAVTGSAALWLALWRQAGLFSGAIMSLAMTLLIAAAYRTRWPGLAAELRKSPDGPTVSWRSEIWPFQWRIGVSWMSGYLLFSLFTPVMFYFHGPVLAGQMGMTLQLVNALSTLAQSWVAPKGPLFGMLISQQKYAELDRVFYRAAAGAVGVCLLGGLVLLPVLAWVRQHLSLGARFLDIPSSALLVLAVVVNQVTASQALYLRAHKREPFVVLSVCSGLVTGVAVAVLGWRWGALGASGAYAAVQLGALAWATVIWRRCRRAWHEVSVTASPPVSALT